MGSRAPARSPRTPPRGGGVGPGWMQQGCAQRSATREAAGGGWVPAHLLALPVHRREAAVWVRVGFSKAAPKRTAKPGGGRRRMGSRAPARSPRTPPRGGGVGQGWMQQGCAQENREAGRRQEADGFPRTCSLSPYTAARRRCGSGLDSARLRPREPRSREAAGGGWVPAHRLALPVHRREAAVWVALTNTLTGAYICSYERRGQSGRTACHAGQAPPHAA